MSLLFRSLALVIFGLLSLSAGAERVKDLATIQGVRPNQLIGYGLVVGLDGTGDQTTQTPFTLQTTLSMLQQMGIVLPPGGTTQIQLKNIAAVMVTGTMEPYAQPGQPMDITVSSMANAKSLKGGTLLMTPLKGADGEVYAMAQGNLVVAGAGAAASGSETVINQLSVGRISAGATIERAVPNNIAQQDTFNIELKTSDFGTANAVADAVNRHFGRPVAQAQNARVISIHPNNLAGYRVSFLAELESVDLVVPRASAKVILNARTGSIVLNESVTLDACAVAHGNLSVIISTTPQVSQLNAFGGGRTVTTRQSQIDINAAKGKVIELNKGVVLAEVVRALNAVGATPQDLLAILQAMKASGALNADIEVI